MIGERNWILLPAGATTVYMVRGESGNEFDEIHGAFTTAFDAADYIVKLRKEYSDYTKLSIVQVTVPVGE